MGGAFVIVFVLVASIGLVLMVSGSDRPPSGIAAISDYYTKEADRMAERHDAWMFYHWCNAVHLKHLAENPPSESFRIERRADGRWFVTQYDGVKRSRIFAGISPYVRPSAVPDGYHHFGEIGEADGFLYREEAERFLAAHIANLDRGQQAYLPNGQIAKITDDERS